jgi:predicted nucleotidyltransferase
MYLDKNSLFFGYPPPLIRKIFCELRWGNAGVRFFSHHLGINKTKAVRLVNKLIKEGYLERTNRDTIATTIKGNSLAMASFAPPITRRTADKKIAELIERAKIVNTSNDYLYKVKRIAVFGSYLTDKDRINDIDVDIILKRKFTKEIQEKKENACIKRAISEGKEFRSFIDQLYYPLIYTQKFLKQHSRAFSLHYEDKILDKTNYKIVYELKE